MKSSSASQWYKRVDLLTVSGSAFALFTSFELECGRIPFGRRYFHVF